MQAQISNARRSLAKQSRAMQKDRQWGCQKQQENKRSAAKIGSLSFSTVNLHQPTSIGKMQASSAEYRELVFFAVIKITTNLEYDLKVR